MGDSLSTSAFLRRQRTADPTGVDKARRERIASRVLQGLCSGHVGGPENAAQWAVTLADALIAELDK